MKDLKVIEKIFEREHESADTILKMTDKIDSHEYIKIFIKCKLEEMLWLIHIKNVPFLRIKTIL